MSDQFCISAQTLKAGTTTKDLMCRLKLDDTYYYCFSVEPTCCERDRDLFDLCHFGVGPWRASIQICMH